MGVTIPAGNAQFNLIYIRTGDAEPMMVTQGYDLDGRTDYQTIAEELYTSWTDYLGPVTDDAVTFDRGELVVGQANPTPDFTVVHVGSVDGSAPGQYLPQNNALLVHKPSNQGGRRHKGRLFIPYTLGVSEVSEVGQVDSTVRNARQFTMNALFIEVATYPTGGLIHVIHHSDLLTTPTVQTGYVVDSRLATQRQRLRR